MARRVLQREALEAAAQRAFTSDQLVVRSAATVLRMMRVSSALGNAMFWIRAQQVGQLIGALCGLALILFVDDSLSTVLGSLLILVNVVGLAVTTRRAGVTQPGDRHRTEQT